MKTIGAIEKRQGKLLYGWLLFAVLSLVFAGIFAFLVAMARTPVVEDLLPLGRDYIYVALVSHVILAFVIWFLAFEGFMFVLTATTGGTGLNRTAGWISLILASTGTVLIVTTAVLGLGYPELANYIPVLLHPLFYTGLALLASGMVICVVNAFSGYRGLWKRGRALDVTSFGMASAGISILSAFICIWLSGYFQFATGKGFFDFERFFWGGGHVLQFANTIAMVTAWVYLARLVFGVEPVGVNLAKAAYSLYLLFVIPAPYIYFIYDTASQQYKSSFTMLMEWGLGPSTVVFAVAILAFVFSGERRSVKWSRPGFSSIILSIAVFGIGGVIAFLIRGVNTIIPAHYHCVIGAVTIAFMGLFYEILPLVDRRIYSERLAKVQPYLYSIGVLMFAAGLFIAGAHGVARKTYGSAQNLNSLTKLVGMSIMGVGGLVAILGGIAFVGNSLASLLVKTEPLGHGVENKELAGSKNL